MYMTNSLAAIFTAVCYDTIAFVQIFLFSNFCCCQNHFTCNITVLSGVEGVNNENVVVITLGNSIIIKNVPSDKLVSVYSSNGELVKSLKALGETIFVEAPIKGLYIVAIDGKSFKVMVK